jgi:Fe-Mn family superoxide dismutase
MAPSSLQPSGALADAIARDFKSPEGMRDMFFSSAVGNFGSGWTWLVKGGDRLSIVNTSNAAMPQKDGKAPLLVCDVWEHAYYIDYRNNRQAYLEAFWKIVNWKFVEEQFAG